jgi:hypothetical protein
MDPVVMFHGTGLPGRWRIVLGALILLLVASPSVAAAGQIDLHITMVARNPDLPAGIPVVTNISPDSGPVTGGTTVTITGTGLHGVTEVDFGPTPATRFVVLNDFSLTAIAPAGIAAGSVVDVSATTPDGSSTISPADEYTYTESVPVTIGTPVIPAVASTIIPPVIPMATQAPLPAAVPVIAALTAVLATGFNGRK